MIMINTKTIFTYWEDECMKRKLLSTVLAVTMAVSRLTGCGQSGTNEATGTERCNDRCQNRDLSCPDSYRQLRFFLTHYEADGEEADENFEHFSFERVEKYILPLLDAAEKAYGGKLDILLSPWSPPVSQGRPMESGTTAAN